MNKLTEEQFCDLHSQFHGEKISSLQQLTNHCFTGEELYEFCAFVVKNIPEEVSVPKEIYNDRKCGFCGLTEGIHKSDCSFFQKL